jgi:hypothetical protein
MKKIFFILVTTLLMYGCVTEKKRAKICATCAVKEERVDSTIYKEYWSFRDSVLNVPEDSARIEYLVGPCPDGSIPPIRQTYKRDGRKTTISGKVEGNKIIVDSKVGIEQLKFEIREKTREIERLKKVTKTLPCEERWCADFFYFSGICAYILAFLILIGAIIWRSLKK